MRERGAGGGIFSIRKFGKWLLRRSAVFFGFFRAKFTWFYEAEREKKAVKKYSCNFFPASCSRTKPLLFLGKVSMMEMGAKGDLQMSSQPPTSPKKNPLVFSRFRYGKGKKNRGEKGEKRVRKSSILQGVHISGSPPPDLAQKGG